MKDSRCNDELQQITRENEYSEVWNFVVSFDVDYGDQRLKIVVCTSNAYYTNITTND